MAPNSPTELAASTSCPYDEKVWPASRRTGTTRPKDVDASTTATNRILLSESMDVITAPPARASAAETA